MIKGEEKQVRATAIVLKSYQAGSLPPAVVMNSLSGASKLPDLAELKEVLSMQHLVRCIEYMYFNSITRHQDSEGNLFQDMKFGKYPAALRQFPACLKEDIPGAESATLESFQDRFYRAIYRLLLAGAVLARAYMEPLFRAREEGGKGSFFLRCGTDYWAEDVEDIADAYPTEEDFAYIRQSPVFNYDLSDWSEVGQWRNRKYETCLGPFASWIIDDGRKREQEKPQQSGGMEPEWAENTADVGAVRELMLLLVAYDHFNNKFQHEHTRNFGGGLYMQKPGNRTVSIVRFGIFQIEEITMPAAVEDLQDTYLLARNHSALEGTEGKDIPYQFNVQKAFFFLKDRMRGSFFTWSKENPGPPGTFELWHFALRHYLNLGFKSGSFWMPRREDTYMQSIWWREVGRGDIFMNPNWAIVQRYRPGVISWIH
jgi:hypothetical protein